MIYQFTFTEDASWGHEREVTLLRELNKSFGISIVGGKVIWKHHKKHSNATQLKTVSLQVNVSGDSLVSGIFIKTIIPGSPADKSGQLKVLTTIPTIFCSKQI